MCGPPRLPRIVCWSGLATGSWAQGPQRPRNPTPPPARYLFLEDPETGDVLMPLIYMKALLEANYSRKLASLKHRVVNGAWGRGC